MLARFHVAEEVTRSPFGVQTRENLDSSQRICGSPDVLSDVMAVENKSVGSTLRDAPDAGLRVLSQHATDQLAIVRFGLCGQSGHGTM